MTRIGILLPTREAVIYGDRTGDPRPLVELAVAAEEAGFDSVWAGDSLLARPRAEPLTLLAAVAARTTRVELGTAVLLASMRNAEQLAQSAATLDAISGGRLILGIGAGPDTPGRPVRLHPGGSGLPASLQPGLCHRRPGPGLVAGRRRPRIGSA
ncbi:MAG: LLM class flavin-dependent oxidoreductase, partial [Acidimicrobiia bacterium]|nr:LLM class flavin-dependent oxidoreductase [Acidimicrobiia bacterium]